MRKNLLTGFFALIIFLLFPRFSFAQVVINEFSSSTSDDWVELYSPQDVDVSGWVLDDDGTTTNMKVFDPGTSIGPSTNSYIVIEVGDRLNNNGDTIELFDNNNNKKDSITYAGIGNVCLPSTVGSVARVPNGGNTIDRLSISTKGVTNGESITDPCPTPTPIPTNSPTSTPTLTNTPSPTPTLTPVPTNSPTKKLSPTQIPEPTETIENGDELVLGSSDSSGESPTPTAKMEKDDNSLGFPYLLPMVFIVIGVGFIATAVYLIIKSRKIDNDEYSEAEPVK